MPDDLTKKRPEDAERINIGEYYEIEYWCEKLDCSQEELIEAVDVVGPMVKDVREYIGL